MSNHSPEKLTLRRETLKRLQATDLTRMVGGVRGYPLPRVGRAVSGRSLKFCESNCIACPR